MGLGDTLRNVLYTFKANTAPLKASVRDLRGEQKKLAKEQLDGLEKTNAGLDKQLAMWGKVAVGVGGAVAAYQLATAAVETFANRSRLENAAAGKDMDSLKTATSGLLTEMQLLTLAADANTGSFRLTQQQLEIVTQGIVALSREGKDLTRVTDRVGQAIREGNVEPLKELGIIIKDVEGDSVEALNAVIAKFQEMGPGAEQAGEDIARAGVEITNGLDDLRSALGEFVDSMSGAFSFLARALRFVVDDLADVGKVALATAAPIMALIAGVDTLVSGITAGQLTGAGNNDAFNAGVARFQSDIDAISNNANRVNSAASRDAAGRAVSGSSAAFAAGAGSVRRGGGGGSDFDFTPVTELVSGGQRLNGIDRFGLDFAQQGNLSGVGFEPVDLSGVTGPGGGGGQFFGGQGDPMQGLIQGSVAGSEAFQLFKNSAVSAMAAVVQGSMSMGQALRKVMGDVIMGKAMKVFAEGIEASVGAAVAFFTPGGQGVAGGLLKAAGFAFAQAGVLFGLARGLGSTGSAPSGRGGIGGGTGGIGPRFGINPGNQTRSTTIHIHGSDSGRSERERQRDIASAEKTARASSDRNPSGEAG